MKKNRIRLSEVQLHKVIKESVKHVLKENQESLYSIICSLEQDIKTAIHNIDSTSNQAFGGVEDKLREISNSLSHVDTNLAKQSVSTFNKLQEALSELQDLRISLKTLGAKDSYWGQPLKTPNGTVGLSNYN